MQQTGKEGWWTRNWKWALPVAIGSGIVLLAGCALAVVSFVFGIMTSSEAYKQAVARASADPTVIAALGTPIAAGYFTSGHIKVNGPSGDAALAIPLAGPKGAATIYLEAQKSVGQWTFSKLVVEITASKRRIDLLAAPTTKALPRSRADGPVSRHRTLDDGLAD